MRLHYLQHVPFEGLASIETWARKSNVVITCTRLFQDEPLPPDDEFDWLVVMGGPMSIHDEIMYPWLAREKTFIRKTIEQGRHVLGICLGAQLIADALGARVSVNDQKEIGWFPIQVADGADQGLRKILPGQLEVVHWHGETFELPDGSTLLATSTACRHQGFVYEDKVIGLQFHLETTRESLEALIAHCGDEIVAGQFIQQPAAMLGDESRFEKINQVMDQLLDEWTSRS